MAGASNISRTRVEVFWTVRERFGDFHCFGVCFGVCCGWIAGCWRGVAAARAAAASSRAAARASVSAAKRTRRLLLGVPAGRRPGMRCICVICVIWENVFLGDGGFCLFFLSVFTVSVKNVINVKE